MGSNPDAVALSGVSVTKMRILIFVLAGFFFGIGQIVNVGTTGGAVNQGLGIGAEFTVMAGAMLGGIKMGGGGGKMSNMVIGVLIIGVLNYGIELLEYQPVLEVCGAGHRPAGGRHSGHSPDPGCHQPGQEGVRSASQGRNHGLTPCPAILISAQKSSAPAIGAEFFYQNA